MTPDEFEVGMVRLEQMFNRGAELEKNVRGEYFEALKYVEPRVFHDVVGFVIDSFKPYPSEPFPSLVVLESAVIEIRSEAGEEANREARDYSPAYLSKLDYCQHCDNVGLYLAEDGQARFCRCEKGRVKRASWEIPYGVRKRDERIQKVLEKVPPSHGPVHGLHEWNPLGFWEDTQEEHDRWMAAKREEIEEIKRRQAERPQGPTLPDELRKKLLRDAIGELRGRMKKPMGREPGEDEEDEEDVVAF